MRLRPGTRGNRERGALSLELAILAPGVIVCLLLMAVGGRIYLARSGVDDAARDAARAASLQTSADQAHSAALEIADQTLAAQGLHCLSTDVQVPTTGFQVPLGQSASVTVTVRCRVNLSDIGMPGLPDSKVLTSSFTSSIDSYRQRTAAAAPAPALTPLPAGRPGGGRRA